MVFVKRLHNLIGTIYDAADDTSAWTSLLEKMGDVFGGSACGVSIDDKKAHLTRVTASIRLDPAGKQKYKSYYHKVDLFTINPRRKTEAGAFASHSGVSDEQLSRSKFYNDFLKPENLFYNLAGQISSVNWGKAYLSLLRARSRGPFTEPEVELLDLLLPHLIRAARFRQHRMPSQQWLDSIRSSVVLVDKEGRVIFANQSAQNILNENDGLTFPLKGLQLDFRDLAKGSVEPSLLKVERPSGRRPYLLRVNPFRASDLDLVF